MLQKERPYKFRERLLTVHEKDILDNNLLPEADELDISGGITICIPRDDEVIRTAAHDFCDYLFTSMDVPATLKTQTENCSGCLTVSVAKNPAEELKEAAGYRGYRIDIDERITICGNDSRGVAQALYRLEDMMTMRKAPFLKKGTQLFKPMYGPMIMRTGFGTEVSIPSEYLNAIAHAGRDAIAVDVVDPTGSMPGRIDFNALIYRAAKYGIDVYAYVHFKNAKHPDDNGAEAFYEEKYGRFFRDYPGFKGVILVGESLEFPSKDPHVSINPVAADGIPTGKVRPGWYPCYDYGQWVELVKNVIRKEKPDADIIFWTYNWGYVAEDIRLKLIESLPTDITLLATFEMFEVYNVNGAAEKIADYTLSFAGPGKYFASEAALAAKRGIRLYSMTNTAGMTWDFGVLPYEPFPYQWIKRYEAMEKARKDWGLCGILEGHHYGFFPSFISQLSKYALQDLHGNLEDILYEIIVSEYGKRHADTVNEALKLWSEAITYYTASEADQYGAFRSGPSYPFCLNRVMPIPHTFYSASGTKWCRPEYEKGIDFLATVPSIRVGKEAQSLCKMRDLMEAGLKLLRPLEDKNEKLEVLINLGEYILRCVITGINAKYWHLLKMQLHSAPTPEIVEKTVNDMIALLDSEIENAASAIPFAEADSSLGWEVSMDYLGNAECIRWKIRFAEYVKASEIPRIRQSLAVTKEYLDK